MRAPTAGNMMLYSIVEIDDQLLKDTLAETCDHQPFIARAPWVLLFVADLQKWMDLFDAAGVDALEGVPHGVAPGLGDLMLACCDALIAAQNAVIAAESLGIGSCYIGDILERGETHAELLHLPRYTFPVTMLCLGRPKTQPRIVERYEKHVVHKNAYRRLSTAERARRWTTSRASTASTVLAATPTTRRRSTRASSPRTLPPRPTARWRGGSSAGSPAPSRRNRD